MKSRIYITLILLSCLGSISLQAQSNIFQYLAQINSTIATIPYVFEGQVTSVEIYAGDDVGNRLPKSAVVWNGRIGYYYFGGKEAKGYSLATIKVCKVYKGGNVIKGGSTIKVLTKSFTLDNIYLLRTGSGRTADTSLRFVNVPPTHDYDRQFDLILPHVSYPKKIYFANRYQTIVPSNYAGKRFYSNFGKLYEMSFNVPVDVPQVDGTYKRINAYAALVPYVFADQTQLQSFLNQINTINPNPPNYCANLTASKEASSNEDEPVIDQTKINYENNLRNYLGRMESLDNLVRVGSNSANNKSAFVDNLNLDIANERLVKVGADNWFEFDVMVSSNNSSLFFDNCLMRIQYNSAAFGSNVVAGNNVVITRATAYNTSTYINPQTNVIDQNSNTIGIPFGTDFSVSTWNRVQHTTAPSKMLTVRLKILTCGQNVNLLFVDQATTSNLSFYANTANASIVNTTAFNTTNYTGNINDQSCTPIINAFTNNVPAGTDQIVTITGKYFGSTKSTGAVIFKNADQGDRYPIMAGPNSGGIQVYDLISWDHNQIVFRLPNIIDSAYYYETINNTPTVVGPTEVYPGSGKFKVKNYAGGVAESSTPIDIPYSVKQWLDGITSLTYRKIRAKIVGQDGGGYRVLINNRINTAWPTIGKANIRKAMKHWSCATNINWYIGGDTTLAYGGDKFCVIDTFANVRPLMQTSSNLRTCIENNVPTYYLRSFDIKIRRSVAPFIWNTDTVNAIPNGDYDFLSAISHELGHAHQVHHINDSIVDLMWYQANPFGYAVTARKLVQPSYWSRSGGNWVTDNLLGNLPSCVGIHVPIFPTNCEGIEPVGIKKFGLNQYNISVYPNPSSVAESLTIEFNLEKEEVVSFTLYGVAGNLIKQTLPEKLSQSINYTFDTGSINAGMYILVIKVGNKQQTVKIIKQ